MKNKEYQKLLLKQMQEQKQKKVASFKAMNSREKSVNAVILRKLDNEIVSQKVVAKLSPDKTGMKVAMPKNNIF